MTKAVSTEIDLATALGRHLAQVSIRTFEDEAARLYRSGSIPGFVHLSSGQEAIAVGVCSNLNVDDVITSTHRGHGHVIAKGADIESMFAELLGRATGTCGGNGGSMHIADPSLGIFGANGIVGAGVPIAAGAALAMRLRGQKRVAVAFFGDGAVATGAFYEGANFAGLLGLPLLLVCEDNGYSEFSASKAQHPVPVEARASAFGISAQVVDGNNVEIVNDAARQAVQRIRSSSRPELLVARTLRQRGHYEGDPQTYRSTEMDSSFEDPITVSRSRLLSGGVDQLELSAHEDAARHRVIKARKRAEDAPWPHSERWRRLVYADHYPQESSTSPPRAPDEEPTRISRIIRQALSDALDADETVFLAGIDVGAGGNVFGLTRGLQAAHPTRVLDTPISETAIMGAAVGAALDGLKPVVELMYLDFVGVCLDQLMNQAAKLRLMTGGRATVGLTVRTQFGVGRSSAAQHSQSLEALLAHIPGLVVVMPSSPEDHYGLLRSAIECPDPVVVIENRLLYEKRAVRVDPALRTPLGRARIAREGSDVTVVSVSQGVWTALDAAERASQEGISVEVIDLRTIAPWDKATVLASLAKTTRIVVHTQSVRDFGVSAEIIAVAVEEGFWFLDAPPARSAGAPAPVPYSPASEAQWLPDADDLLRQIRSTCAV